MFLYKVLTSSKLVCASFDHIYVPIIMYCLRLFVVVLQEIVYTLLQNISYADAHLQIKYSQSFVLIASPVNELCVWDCTTTTTTTTTTTISVVKMFFFTILTHSHCHKHTYF